MNQISKDPLKERIIMGIESAREVFMKLGEFLRDLFEKVKIAWNFIKEKLPEIKESYFKKQEQVRKTKASWYVQKDTRKKHQLFDNKPKYLVKKIIR